MTYTPTTWSDEVPQTTPVKYTIRTSAGAIIYDDVQIDIKTTVTPGTSVNAANLNKIEQGIVTLENATVPKVFTAYGDLFVGQTSGVGQRLGLGAEATVLESYPYGGVGMYWVPPIFVRYKRTTTQSISNNSLTIIDFATQEVDPQSRVTTGASWKFTANWQGAHLVTVTVCFETTSTWAPGELAYLDLYKNGVFYARLARLDNIPANSTAVMLSGATIANLTSSDYLNIRIYQNSGGALNLVADGTHNHVSIARIR